MIKQVLLPIVGVMLFIVLVGLYSKNPSAINLGKYFPVASPQADKVVTIGAKTVQVEIVNTESAREKGLGERSTLPADQGMLFVFDPKPVSPIFWMKDMLIPLDIIWIKGDKIVKIDKNIPAPPANTPDSKLDRLSPNQPVDFVLEVNGGFSGQNNIKVGDSVTLPVGL